MSRPSSSLTPLAKLGFASLASAAQLLEEVSARHPVESLLPHFSRAADPDQALVRLNDLLHVAEAEVAALLADPGAAERLLTVLGASNGLAEFFLHHPEELSVLAEPMKAVPGADAYGQALLDAVADIAEEEAAWDALRIRYRSQLARLTAFDLAQPDPVAAIDDVTRALSDLAAAALDASLAVARRNVPYSAEEVAATRLAVIGMGKAGARELNYVSDVDVVFVVEAADNFSTDRAIQVGTALAMQTMRGAHGLCQEPPLWEVDANLRPEGKD